MKAARKAKVSVTLSRNLLSAIDRHVTRGTTRSQVIEEWLRFAAIALARRDLDRATAAYYEGRNAEQRAEDESLATFATDAFNDLDLDQKPRDRRHRAR